MEVKDVEVESEQVGFENLYVNGDHFGESIEGDAVEAKVASQSFVITRSITSSEQMSEASGEAKDKQDEEAGLEGSISDENTDGVVNIFFKATQTQAIISVGKEPCKAATTQASDVVAVIDKIKEAEPEIGNKSLEVKDVEVEFEQVGSENLYVNGDHFGESIEGDVVEAEVASESFVITGSITSSEQMSKASGEAKDKKDEEAGLKGSSDGKTDGMYFVSFETVKQFIEELEMEYSGGSYSSAEAP
ncbi:hypothetical protein RND71_013916 [Anisodus tanguticus]|uniref:Uncharacterized protein n=1 Tax=Anisodus tanguticus TaxID=243964 RepID=A0AAE1SBP6_9SOLA|nr:hypothetical protein RND71_013916 [Anisodus tanguticus]